MLLPIFLVSSGCGGVSSLEDAEAENGVVQDFADSLEQLAPEVDVVLSSAGSSGWRNGGASALVRCQGEVACHFVHWSFDPTAAPEDFESIQDVQRTISFADVPSDGEGKLRVYVRNELGVRSTILEFEIRIDRRAPELVATGLVAAAVIEQGQIVQLQCRDAHSGCRALWYRERAADLNPDGNNIPWVALPHDRAHGVSIGAVLGSRILEWRALDAAGNESEVRAIRYEVSSSSPLIGVSQGAGIYHDELTIMITCADGGGVCRETRYTLDGSDPRTSVNAQTGSTIQLTENNEYTLRIYAENEAGVGRMLGPLVYQISLPCRPPMTSETGFAPCMRRCGDRRFEKTTGGATSCDCTSVARWDQERNECLVRREVILLGD